MPLQCLLRHRAVLGCLVWWDTKNTPGDMPGGVFMCLVVALSSYLVTDCDGEVGHDREGL